jgi:hypothetical protein
MNLAVLILLFQNIVTLSAQRCHPSGAPKNIRRLPQLAAHVRCSINWLDGVAHIQKLHI